MKKKKWASNVAHNWPQTSPELIFHIIDMSQDSSVSLSVYMAHLNRLSIFCTGKKARFLTQQTMLLALALAKGVLLAKLRATGRMYKVATLHSTIAQVHMRHLAPCAAVLRREAEQVDNLDAFIAPGYMLAYLSFQPFFFLRGNGNS